MFVKHCIFVITHIGEDMILYTDGSCDNPQEPYTSRAAWAVVLKQSTNQTYQSQTFQVLATGHCTGLQTINRAELYAMVVAVEAIAPLQPSSCQGL